MNAITKAGIVDGMPAEIYHGVPGTRARSPEAAMALYRRKTEGVAA